MSGKTCCADCAAAFSISAPSLPDALAPLPGDDVWLVPVQFQGQPLRVVVDQPWPGYDGGHVDFWIDVHLFLVDDDGDERVDTIHLPFPFDSSVDFPLHFTVDPDKFNYPGFYSLYYQVYPDSGNFDDSLPIRIEIDHRAPNSNNPGDVLIFPAEVIRDGVTEDWLARNGDELKVEVPRWPDMEIGDTVHFYWGTPFDIEPVGFLVIDELLVAPDTPIEFAYSGDILRAKGNGELNGYYVLSDRAGNRNPSSPKVLIDVIDLPAVPDDFPAPVVPLATVDKLIDLADARTGVVVEIGPIVDAAPGDTLQTWWNGRQLRDITLPPALTWPQTVPVDWAILSADGFAAPVVGNVQYRWQRGTGPSKDSPMTSFTVDLTVAGPDPVGPDPINPNLSLLVVKGLTGDNVLVGPDVGKDALVLLDLYGNPRTGDLLELHWGDHPQVAATYRVKSTDLPGQQVSFEVPWSIIESVGNNPQLPTFYWVSNGVNRQRSRETLVRVAVRSLEGLEQPSIPDANIYNYIGCLQEPWKGIRVRIPGNAVLLEAGDLIEMSWQLCRQTTGEDPMTEHVFFPPHRLTATEAVEGVILLMDRFADLVLPLHIKPGSANVGYQLTKQDGTPGKAPYKTVRIDLGLPGNTEPCDGTNGSEK